MNKYFISIFGLSVLMMPALSYAKMPLNKCSGRGSVLCSSGSNNSAISSTKANASSSVVSKANAGLAAAWDARSRLLTRTRINESSRAVASVDQYSKTVDRLEKQGDLGEADADSVRAEIDDLKQVVMSATEDNEITAEERQAIASAQKDVKTLMNKLSGNAIATPMVRSAF